MSKQKLFMLVYDIDINKGGLNQAMFRRASTFSDLYDTYLITLDSKRNYAEIKNKLFDMGRLSSNVKILNIHDYYYKKYSTGQINEEQINSYQLESTLAEQGFDIQDDEFKTKHYARYFKDGEYIKYKKWSKQGRLLHIDYFERRCRTSRVEFSSNGSIYKKTTYYSFKNIPVQESFFSDNGTCYLIIWYNPKNGSLSKIFLLNGSKYISFNNRRSFNTYWLENIAKESNSKPIVVCDGPGSSAVVSKSDPSLIHKIIMIHTNHFDKPHTPGSPIKSDHENIFNNINQFDAMVVLTEQQRSDIITQYGIEISSKIHVIPHSVNDTLSIKNKSIDKEKKLVSVISRYHPEKRIDDSILAFKRVVQHIPQAILQIHGEGEDRSRLQQLIIQNDLTENVFLKGYCSNPTEIYRKSLLTVLTSQFEGLGLALIESMQNKTPVIAYDVPYGPCEIIQNDINGYLIDQGDINQLASKIIDLLNEPNLAIKMGINAEIIIREEYSFNRYKTKWSNLLNTFR